MPDQPSGPLTAAELMAQLAADPAYRAQEAERVARQERRDAAIREDERELVDELRRCGVTVDGVWDLIGASELTADAVSLLIDHLVRPHEPAIHEGIARALAGVPAADRARTSTGLRDALATERVEHVRDAICLAIGELAGPDDLDELVELLGDASVGPSRVMLLSALTRYGDRGRAALEAATSDPVLNAEATHQLRSMRRRSARPGSTPTDPR